MPNVDLDSKWPRVVAVTIAQALVNHDEIAVLVGGTESKGDPMDKVAAVVERCLVDALGEGWRERVWRD